MRLWLRLRAPEVAARLLLLHLALGNVAAAPHQSAADLSAVDWTDLDRRGFVWLKDFIPESAAAAHHIVRHWKHVAQPNLVGKSSSFATDPPAIAHVKERMKLVGAAIAASRTTELTPDPLSVNCSRTTSYFHVGTFEGAASASVFAKSAPRPLHTDRNTLWEFTDSNAGFINLFLPLAKANATDANLRLAPYDLQPAGQYTNLRAHGANAFLNQGFGKPVPAASVANASCLDEQCTHNVANVVVPGRSMYCPPLKNDWRKERRLPFAFTEPHLDVGDLLVARGDVLHASGQHTAFRLAASVRLWDRLPTAADMRATLKKRTIMCTKRRELIEGAIARVEAGRAGCETFLLDPAT